MPPRDDQARQRGGMPRLPREGGAPVGASWRARMRRRLRSRRYPPKLPESKEMSRPAPPPWRRRRCGELGVRDALGGPVHGSAGASVRAGAPARPPLLRRGARAGDAEAASRTEDGSAASRAADGAVAIRERQRPHRRRGRPARAERGVERRRPQPRQQEWRPQQRAATNPSRPGRVERSRRSCPRGRWGSLPAAKRPVPAPSRDAWVKPCEADRRMTPPVQRFRIRGRAGRSRGARSRQRCRRPRAASVGSHNRSSVRRAGGR